ncbi:hypothetical protein AYO44_15825 [Planctomycetaceae bacterium SCGC AG-212-F19]|nr:hypothetical protein AYO44_15825 [Planctomycetaceae bacterium SCGC AG-212-F19]
MPEALTVFLGRSPAVMQSRMLFRKFRSFLWFQQNIVRGLARIRMVELGDQTTDTRTRRNEDDELPA